MAKIFRGISIKENVLDAICCSFHTGYGIEYSSPYSGISTNFSFASIASPATSTLPSTFVFFLSYIFVKYTVNIVKDVFGYRGRERRKKKQE